MNDVIRSQFELLCIMNSILDETRDCRAKLEEVIEEENKSIDI